MFDMLIKFMMSLVILMTITFIGVGVMAAVAEETGSSPFPDIGALVTAAIGWFPVIIVAVAGIMVFALLFSVFGSDASFPAPPAPAAQPPARLYWEADTQTVRSVPTRQGTGAPAPVRPTAPTTADLIAADKALTESTPYREMPALPAWDTDVEAQCAKNQSRAKDMVAALSSGKRPPWATSRAS